MSHAWLALVLLVACSGDDDAEDKVDADTDTDTDADSDADADTDTDVPAVDADGDGFDTTVDCDDADETVFPGAPDVCGDEKVTDCDRTADDRLVTLDGTQGFDDLGDALLAASSGSELLICRGTYVGSFEATVPVRLVAFGDPAETILDGDSSGTTLTVPGGTEIVGLTITGGNADHSGGGILLTAGSLLLDDTIVTGNRARFGGGLAIAEGAVVTLIDSRIEDNVAREAGGGVQVGAGAVLDLTANSSVSRNTAEYYGGGVHLDAGVLVGGVVSENQLLDYAELGYPYGEAPVCEVPYGGAGVTAIGSGSVTGTDILSNFAVNGGGGIASCGGELVLTDVSVHDNRSDVGAGFVVVDGTLRLVGTAEIFENSGYAAAGGMLIGATLVGGVVRDNEALDFGGGVVPFTGTVDGTLVTGNAATTGGGVFSLGQVVLRNVTIAGNTADDGAGIGSGSYYYVGDEDSLTIEGSTISGNTGSRGGGLFTTWQTTITDTTFADNVAELGAAMVLDEAPATMSGGAVVRNVASERGGGVWINGTTFGATGVDFGADVDDNLPGDVYAGDAEVGGYGSAATFSCNDAGCTP